MQKARVVSESPSAAHLVGVRLLYLAKQTILG